MPRNLGQRPRKRRAASPVFQSGLPHPEADGLLVPAAEEPAQQVTTALPDHRVKIIWPSVLQDRFIYLILLLPALVLSWNTNYIYSPAGNIDPWVYYGYMRHLGAMKVMFP